MLEIFGLGPIPSRHAIIRGVLETPRIWHLACCRGFVYKEVNPYTLVVTVKYFIKSA